jgi:putative ABC transport system ATP-binding protein
VGRARGGSGDEGQTGQGHENSAHVHHNAAVGDRFEFVDVGVDGDGGPIVRGFSARVPAAGLTVLIGPSGCGKTTLLRLVNRLDDPDHGDVLLDGRNVRDYDVLDLRRRVQLVGQVPVTFPGTVASNVGAGGAGGVAGVGLLERVGLPAALAERAADALSVGEAQRMCLARALAVGPEVLALDEPTSALDAASKGGVERLIRSLADEGLTVVMVTHDPAHVEWADHVVEVGR